MTKVSDYRRWFGVPAGSALLLAVLLLIGHHWLSARRGLLDEVAIQAQVVGDAAAAALAFKDEETGSELLASVGRSPLIDEAVLYLADGRALARYRRDGVADDSFGGHVPPVGRVFSPRDLRVVAPVVLQARTIGFVALRANLDSLRRGMLNFVAGLAAIILLCGLLYGLASRRLRRRMADAEQALEHQARHDRVTGLPNRYAFEIALEQTLNRHQRHGGGSALLFIDVDGFKKVNDMFGHHAGDRTLVEIGRRMGECLRASDVVARLGGDEFGVIVADAPSPVDVGHVAEHLIAAMAAPIVLEQEEAHLGLSIGIALLPADGGDAEAVLRCADMAMYHAKSLGKNRYEFFSRDIGAAVHSRHETEVALRNALQFDQLTLEYQPQVGATTGTIEGIEALLRWRHPHFGMVSPADFIPVAEESDLIIDIGNWVLRRACDDITDWHLQGIAVPPVAVNVSARQFTRGRVAEEVSGALERHGLSPGALELELTESVVMDRPESHAIQLASLRAAGLRMAIDDFGTGYSSLAYLKRLPVDKIKVDRSFVADLPDDQEDRAIVTAIIRMAKALGLRTVAEGVETEAQADLLRALGCDLLQGYFTGRPMSKQGLTARLLANAVFNPSPSRAA